jgi:hypothetical protein
MLLGAIDNFTSSTARYLCIPLGFGPSWVSLNDAAGVPRDALRNVHAFGVRQVTPKHLCNCGSHCPFIHEARDSKSLGLRRRFENAPVNGGVNGGSEN